MILVTGANGNFGQATIEFLLNQGIDPRNLAGLVREEAKGEKLKAKGVNVRIGDYDDYASLKEAFKGVDKLLLVSGSDIEHRSEQHKNAIEAAREACVPYMAYTSFERKTDDKSNPLGTLATSHVYAEKLIRESGIPYTIFRNNMYLDFVPMFLGENVLETGIYVPAGDGKAAFATRNEMAEAAANVLAGEGHENKEYHFSNSEAVSFGNIADILSEITGEKVSYTSPDKTTYINTLVEAGVDRSITEMSAAFAEATKQGELAPENPDLERLLGRKPTTIRAYLKEIYK